MNWLIKVNNFSSCIIHVGNNPVGNVLRAFKTRKNCMTIKIHIYLGSLRYKKKDKDEE